MTKKTLPPYVYRDRGYLRFLRRSTGQSVMMKEDFDTPEFWDHYNRLRRQEKPVVEKPSKRTFETLILSYYKSPQFTGRKPRTKKDYRLYIGHIQKIWSDRDPQKVQPHHVYDLHQANADHWRQANYLVQVLVILFNHARLIGFLKKEHMNPALGIPLFKQNSDGWEPWPDELRAEFEEKATPRARLVYELSIGLGQRIGDTLLIDWKHIKMGAWDFNQCKALDPPDGSIGRLHRALEARKWCCLNK